MIEIKFQGGQTFKVDENEVVNWDGSDPEKITIEIVGNSNKIEEIVISGEDTLASLQNAIEGRQAT